MAKILTGMYRTREGAVRAAERLIQSGFTRDEVCLMAPDEPGAHFAVKPVHETLSGVGGGALMGMIVGALIGPLQSFAAVAFPAFQAMAGGPLLSALVGAGVGAAIGGLIGALVGATRVHHETVVVHGHDPGFTLVGVTAPRTMERSAEELLHAAGARKITKV